MNGLGRYILSVICAALIAGILRSMAGKGTMEPFVNLLCGVFLALTVIAPAARVDMDTLLDLSLFETQESVFSQEGVFAARQALMERIKRETESYILDKAKALGGEVTVDVSLSEDDMPVPISAALAGPISSYAKYKLEEMLQTDLGISKENIRWIG